MEDKATLKPKQNQMSNKVRTFVRWWLFGLMFIAIWCLVPVPSAKTPNARNFLNEWANHISAQIAKVGFDCVSDDNVTTCVAQERQLCIKRHDRKTIDTLTFAHDNIFALSLRMILILLSYLLICEPCLNARAVGQKLLACVTGFLVFAAVFAIRDLLFGMYVVFHRVEDIGYVDNFIRGLLIIIMILVSVTIFGCLNWSSRVDRT